MANKVAGELPRAPHLHFVDGLPLSGMVVLARLPAGSAGNDDPSRCGGPAHGIALVAIQASRAALPCPNDPPMSMVAEPTFASRPPAHRAKPTSISIGATSRAKREKLTARFHLSERSRGQGPDRVFRAARNRLKIVERLHYWLRTVASAAWRFQAHRYGGVKQDGATRLDYRSGWNHPTRGPFRRNPNERLILGRAL